MNKDENLLKLGRRIKSLREAAGYTSYEVFAFEKGLSRSLYGSYEKGANITYLNLIKVSKALDVTLEELFKDL